MAEARGTHMGRRSLDGWVCGLLVLLMICLVQGTVVGRAEAAISLNTESGCATGTTGVTTFGPVAGPSDRVLGSDCTVSFGSDTAIANLDVYQLDQAGTAMTSGSNSIADFHPANAHWGSPVNMFGACLRTTASNAVTNAQTWAADADTTADEPAASADCADGNADPWYPVAATAARIATTSAGGTRSAPWCARGWCRSGDRGDGVAAGCGGECLGDVVPEVAAA